MEEKLMSSPGEPRPRLKVFFGMCAGVGKTWAMLEDARAAKARGIDLVLGYVETHGRPDTGALLQGLETIPPRAIDYRGMVLEEPDFDAIVARRPGIVIIDELAHSNAPGSTHVRRWQDILELLERGISVWTALNVQHVESLADVVEDLTGVAIRERVPDTVLDRADELRLIDLPPADLARRLAEGKVYEGEGARKAAAGFFKERNLGALRELALRFAARAAERRLRTYARAESQLAPKDFADGRILVAVGSSPSSAYLVRWARRAAWALKATWLAVHIDSGPGLGEADSARLEANLALARGLGAETLVVQSEDIAGALVQTAKRQSASMIVIGRSGLSRLGLLPRRATVPDRIVREAGPIAVAVVQDAITPRRDLTLAGARQILKAPPRQYALLGAIFLLLVAGGSLLSPLVGYRAIALLYLAAVLGLSFVASPGPVAFLAVLSALTLNFLFIPPRFTLRIDSVEDLILFAAYFLVAFVTSALVTRLRTKEGYLKEREGRLSFLFQAAERLAACRNVDDAASVAADIVEEHFEAPAAVLVTDAGGRLREVAAGQAAAMLDSRELAAAAYALKEGKVCGHGSEALPSARLRFIPALFQEESSGVIGIRPQEDRPWRRSDDNLVLSLGRTLALIIEREKAESRCRAAALELESDRLSRVLLDSVSHELRTPLTTITGSLSALTDERLATSPEARHDLIQGALEASARLDRIVEDILSMSRIESGSLCLSRSLVDLEDLARDAILSVGPELEPSRVRVLIPEGSRPASLDFGLSSRLLCNLLRNSARYAPSTSPVSLSFREEGRDLIVEVADRGPGVAEAELATVFERFRRGRKAGGPGLGLGLAICRGIALAHGGSLEAHNAPQGGLRITWVLPGCLEPPRNEEGKA